MAIFGIDEKEQERVRRRAQEAIQEHEKQTGRKFKPEKGIEELDLEEAVPGGAYIGMVNPVGVGKKLAKEGAEVVTEKVAKEAPGLLKKLADKMPVKTLVDKYYEALARAQKSRTTGSQILRNKEEIAKEARKAKIKPTEFQYDRMGNPTEVRSAGRDDLYQEIWNEEALKPRKK